MVTWGGVGTYSLDLLRHLAPLAAERGMTILGLRRAGDRFLEGLPELAAVTWRIVDADPWSLRGALAAGRAARGAVDVYHAPHVTVPLGFDGPLVTTVHDLIPLLHPESMPNLARRTVFRAAVDQAIRRSAVVLTVSRFTAQTLYDFGYRPRHLAVTPNGVDGRFRPQPAEEVARVAATYGLPRGYVLWVGAFKPHKNVHTLVEAYASLPPAVRTAHSLVLAGDTATSYGEHVRGLAAATPAGREVLFPGRIDGADLPALYSGAALFVFPSLVEGFGLPPLEAAACGTPVLASDAPPLPEVLGEAAEYVDGRDPVAFGEELSRRLARGRESASVAAPVALSWLEVALEVTRGYLLAASDRRNAL